MESILTGSITSWYGNCSATDRKAQQRIVGTAHHGSESIHSLSAPPLCPSPTQPSQQQASQCRTNLSALDQEVLSGEGWDNLRSMDMGRVMNFSYSQCQTTEDGVYLIPDEVFVIPQKFTDVVTSSEVISNWFEQHSSTSQSINVGVSFLPGLNAKFSTENQWVKTHQVQDRSVTNRAVAVMKFHQP
ncbi:macrophage-expressed gene 1 protein-like [Salmo trutta]|uniref:macrophage-expressed gene 1 protein-like n=1 Tax=Salmo trutta TaxID=8032 RepID=UPI0011325E5F|nr:macrophage-expressed gene 1 protein-like [Salmo trutta]